MKRMVCCLVFISAYTGTALAEPPTFSSDVAHIVYTNCTPCHRPGGGAPMSFQGYDEVKQRARMIAKVTADRYMPPWKAEPGDLAFSGERHLSETDLATLAAWAQAGAPLGDAAAVPPAPVFDSEWQHGKPDFVIEMEQDMPVPAEGPDIYRGFVVRMPELPEGKYLKGMEYRPRAIQSAHHTLFSLDTTGDARSRAEASPRPGFGGMEGNLSLGRIGGWAVGAIQPLYPDGVSLAIQPGTDMVLATHFHPSGKAETERARIGLYLTDEKPTRYMTGLDVPFGFGVLKGIKIPAGEKNYTIDDSFTLPADAELAILSPHAHYIAKTMSATATLPDGRSLKLITVRDWDFAWQEQYQLKEPLHLPKGTRVDMHFVYDNSAENPRNPNDPPREITFGPSSTDEMACITMGLITDTEQQNLDLRNGYIAWVKQSVDKADFSALTQSARAQRRDRLDLNGDGSIAISEVWSELGRLRKRFANPARDNLQAQILPLIAGRVLRTVVLPWLLPRALAALALLVALFFGVRYALRLRSQRKAALDKKPGEEQVPQGA